MTQAQREKIEARIKAELDKQTFSGYCGTSKLFTYSWKELKDMCAGELIVSIGEGEFNAKVGNVIQYSIAWGEYQETKRALQSKYGWEAPF